MADDWLQCLCEPKFRPDEGLEGHVPGILPPDSYKCLYLRELADVRTLVMPLSDSDIRMQALRGTRDGVVPRQIIAAPGYFSEVELSMSNGLRPTPRVGMGANHCSPRRVSPQSYSVSFSFRHFTSSRMGHQSPQEWLSA